MTREEIIAVLEQHIETLERQQANPKLDLDEGDWQLLQDANEGTTDLLRRIKSGDESAFQEVDDLLEMG
jgi:hypothetical protein